MQSPLDHQEEVLIRKKGAFYEVHWNYQNAPDALTLRLQCERLDGFMDGFIDGALAALEIPTQSIHRFGCVTGTAKNLEESIAIKLATILSDMFRVLLKIWSKNQSAEKKSGTFAGIRSAPKALILPSNSGHRATVNHG
ncbi:MULTISPECIES: hypothetical protein [unclassified Pseudomonas]|uniref:hypothetical protein n=1 Tax=unclassified Pseudomonas TaxID=196821 RepID=UPI000A1F33D4|nr:MULTISPECIES: hypothetical protein [unclassified Pseudomonas]